MKKWIRRLAITLTAILLLIGLALFSLSWILQPDCGAEIMERIQSPNGHLSAVVFNYDCGATTGFNTQISLLKPSEVPNSPGTVFVIDDNNGQVTENYSKGGPKVRITWVSDNKLKIEHPNFSRVFKQEKLNAGISIEYSTY
jgi:hypothetical protein